MRLGPRGIARGAGRSRGKVARASAAVLALSGMASALFAGCGRKPEIAFDIGLPASITDATWIEVGAFSGVCPPTAQLGGGIPVVGAVTRAAFRFGEQAPPALGDVPRGTYAFMAVAKRDDCGVVAAGCSTVDVGEARSVSIALVPTEAPSGACAAGTVCTAARCVPGLDNADPSVGAECSLQLIGAGPLANPLPNLNVRLSAPAITATPAGFLVAYREYSESAARLTIVPVDSGGGSLPAVFETLADRCGNEETDATGMAFNGDVGLVVVARAECPSTAAGLNMFSIDASGAVQRRGVIGVPAVRKLALSPAHAVAPIPGTTDFYLAALRDDRAAVSQTRGVAEPTGAADFGGTAPMTGGWVASSTKTFALLAAGGASASGDGGAEAGGGGGGGSPTLRLQLAAAGSSLTSLRAPYVFPGAWGSLAAQGTRVVVASDGAALGRPVALQIFDLNLTGPIPLVEGYSPEGLGKVLYADVALQQDHLFLAVEQAGAISLVAYDHASTAPSLVREISFARDPRIPSITSVRDGHIAVAASDTRVGVAWTTGQTLTQNDVVGGYAIFACRTPQ